MIICDGRCVCAACAGEDIFLPFRLWPGRVVFATDPVARKVSVFFNGTDITQQCTAAAEGESGWATIYAWRAGESKAHICACKQGACARLLNGRVKIADRTEE